MKLEDYIGETTSYDDRMEIVSPGGMPSGKRVQELDLRQVSSMRRNPVIADLFQRLDLMERRGSGFKKILDAYAFESEKRGEVVTPRFESTSTDFFLILPDLNYGRVINGVDSSSEGLNTNVATEVSGGKTGMKTGMKAGMKTADAIVALILENPTISHDTLAEKLGRARSSIIEQITKLKASGRIRRVGPDKGGHWEVIDETAEGK